MFRSQLSGFSAGSRRLTSYSSTSEVSKRGAGSHDGTESPIETEAGVVLEADMPAVPSRGRQQGSVPGGDVDGACIEPDGASSTVVITSVVSQLGRGKVRK
jgi:hypothetical protein